MNHDYKGKYSVNIFNWVNSRLRLCFIETSRARSAKLIELSIFLNPIISSKWLIFCDKITL